MIKIKKTKSGRFSWTASFGAEERQGIANSKERAQRDAGASLATLTDRGGPLAAASDYVADGRLMLHGGCRW